MKKRIALALVLGATMAFGAVACDSSSTSTTSGGSGGAGDSSVPTTCTGDTHSATITVTTLQIPGSGPAAKAAGADTDGFNLDGANTPAAPKADAAGCYIGDTGTPPSIDNQLAVIAPAAKSILDIPQALQDAVTNKQLQLTAVISQWNGTTTDDCVTVSLQSSGTEVGKTNASVTNGIANIVLPDPITLTVTVKPTACTPGTYTSMPPTCTSTSYSCTATLPLTIAGVHLRANMTMSGSTITLNTDTPLTAGSPTITNPSMLAGHIVFWDSSSGKRPGCATTHLTDSSFEAVVQQALCDIGQGNSWAAGCTIIAGSLDLHDAGGGSLTACAAGGTSSTSNANSISIGAYVGGTGTTM